MRGSWGLNIKWVWWCGVHKGSSAESSNSNEKHKWNGAFVWMCSKRQKVPSSAAGNQVQYSIFESNPCFALCEGSILCVTDPTTTPLLFKNIRKAHFSTSVRQWQQGATHFALYLGHCRACCVKPSFRPCCTI